MKEHPRRCAIKQTVFCQNEECPSNQDGICANESRQLDMDNNGLCVSQPAGGKAKVETNLDGLTRAQYAAILAKTRGRIKRLLNKYRD